LIKRLTSEGRNLLILDAGNLFFLKLPKKESQRKDSIRKVDVLIHAYNAMGYDAVNIGERDLIMGYRFLADAAKKAKFTFVSSNLTDKMAGSPPFVSHIIKDIAGLKIGIFGLIDEKAISGGDPMITASDPVKKARGIVKDLRRKCDVIVALSQLGEAMDRRLVQAIPDIDIIIGGVKAREIRHERVGNTIMARLIPRGGYLGVLNIQISRKGHPYKFQNLKEKDELLKKIERIRFRCQIIQDEMEGLPSREKKVKQKELEILKRRERELQAKAVSYGAVNSFRNESIPVTLRVEDDPGVAQFVAEYQRQEAKGIQGELEIKRRKPMGLSEKELIASIPEGSLYRGAISCKRCHIRNYNAWLRTGHSKATETIVESMKKSTFPGECLPCHTTGYGEAGEYEDFDEIPIYLWGIQCETCHGPGKGHPGFGARFRRVTLGVCRTCHTKEQSPAFNYRSYLLRIGCAIGK
jgi:hypothetical protein